MYRYFFASYSYKGIWIIYTSTLVISLPFKFFFTHSSLKMTDLDKLWIQIFQKLYVFLNGDSGDNFGVFLVDVLSVLIL